jgi:hypothetical protein
MWHKKRGGHFPLSIRSQADEKPIIDLSRGLLASGVYATPGAKIKPATLSIADVLPACDLD